MTQKIITLDPAEFDSILIQFKPAEAEHIKGELGIDVSKWQGTVIWDGMAQAGVGFAGIRATLGASGKDELFRRNWGEALRVGIQRLPYHLWIHNAPARPQLDNLLNSLGSDKGELPCVIDVEPVASAPVTDKVSNTREIAIWLSECEERTGKRPLIYTNLSAWTACTTIPAWSANYPLWLAHYTTALTPRVPLPWTYAQLWQYSSTGNIAGHSPIDLNRWGPY